MEKDILENYNKTQELMRELKKTQDAMKAEIMAAIKNGSMKRNGYLAIVTDCQRSSLDKKAIIAEHGADFVEEFTKVTEYKKLEVKKVG